jgi:hypothetical protein
MMSPKIRIPIETKRKVLKVVTGVLNIKQTSLLLLQIDRHGLRNS